MGRALLALAVAGCNFRHGLASGVDDAQPEDVALDSRIAPFCDPQDSQLVACYPFDGNTQDASGHNLNATTTNITFVAGKEALAMQFGSNSAADVADSPRFDVGALTIEAWIKPTQLPATGARMGIVDCQGQWGFFLHDAGQLKCSGGGIAMLAPAAIVVDEWTHVACTYDGSNLAIYARGQQLLTVGGGGAISAAGSDGISLAADNPPGAGSRFIGQIDQLRIMSRPRTAQEICQDAGTCP